MATYTVIPKLAEVLAVLPAGMCKPCREGARQ